MTKTSVHDYMMIDEVENVIVVERAKPLSTFVHFAPLVTHTALLRRY